MKRQPAIIAGKINRYLMILLPFTIPLSIRAGSIVAGAIAGLWVLEGNFAEKVRQIRSNEIALAFLAFFGLHILGLLWTEDLKWGFTMAGKEWKLLFMAVALTLARKEDTKYYFYSLFAATTIAVIVSYLCRFGIIHLESVPDYDPRPFRLFISYNIVLAFCIYSLLYFILFHQISGRLKALFLVLVAAMVCNNFITGGRAGYAGLLGLCVLLAFQYSGRRIHRAAAILLVVALVTGAFYNYSTLFRDRVNAAFQNALVFRQDPFSSVGVRMNFLINSMEIVKRHPLMGVGTGDFRMEYRKINDAKSPQLPATVNPHNNYVFVLCQFGVAGLIVFFSMFYLQIRRSLITRNRLTCHGLGLTVLMLIVMLGDSYLLGHSISLLFCFFSGVLYKRYEEDGAADAGVSGEREGTRTPGTGLGVEDANRGDGAVFREVSQGISATVLTRNSGAFIGRCLEKLQVLDEVIVLDTGSTDDTLSIASGFPNVRVFESGFTGFGPLKNMAADYASNDWILNIDSDEIVSDDLPARIEASRLDARALYSFARENHYNGRLIKCCGWHPDRVMRLYNRKTARFNDNLVHESLVGVNGERLRTVHMAGTIRHFSFHSPSDLIDKMQRYAVLYAKENRGRKKSSPGRALSHALFAFLRNYFLQRGFLYGYEGLLISISNANGVFYKYAMLYEENMK